MVVGAFVEMVVIIRVATITMLTALANPATETITKTTTTSVITVNIRV